MKASQSTRRSARIKVPREDLLELSRTDAARRRNPHVQRSYIIPVFCKALTIMEILKNSDRPLNIQQLSKTTGIAKTTVYRILRTLSAYGYLPDGAEGVYSFQHVPYPPQSSRSPGKNSVRLN